MLTIKKCARNFCVGLILLVVSFSGKEAFGQGQNIPSQEFKIDIQKLNNSLGKAYSTLDLGKPIPLRPSANYLITVGEWQIERKPGQVQGEVFRRTNPFWPDPDRMEHIFINGNFKELILFNGITGSYKSLVEANGFIQQIQILNPNLTRNKDQLLLCTRKRPNDLGYDQMHLISVARNTSFFLIKEGQKVLDWAVNAGTRELIILTESTDASNKIGKPAGSVNVTKIELETLLIQ